MKKATLSIVTAIIMAFAIPVKAGTEPRVETTTPVTIPAEAQRMLDRLYEIQAMDLNSLNKAEKKQLRKEVKEIRHDLKAMSGGVWLSATAIIIILLILVLLT